MSLQELVRAIQEFLGIRNPQRVTFVYAALGYSISAFSFPAGLLLMASGELLSGMISASVRR